MASKDRLNIGVGAADDSKDFAGRRLLLQRLRELTVPGLQLPEQAHVLDRDHRLVGERLEEGDLAVRERPRLLPTAYTGEAERQDRPIVNAPIGDRDRSGATLAGRSAVELPLLSP